MNVDIIFLVILGLSVLFAFFRGFVASFLSLIAWAVAVAASLLFRESGASLLEAHITNPMIAQMIAGSGIFFLSLILLGMINTLILQQTKDIRLGAVDRTLGVAFGVVRGGFICMAGVLLVIVISAMLTPENTEKSAVPEWMEQSRSYPLLHAGLERVLAGISPNYLKQFRETVKDAQEQFLLSAANKDIDFSALSDPNIMDKLVQELPPEEREKLYANSQKNGKNAEDAEIGRAQFALGVLQAYRQAVERNQIKGEALPLNTIKALELAIKRQLQNAKAAMPVTNKGYQEKQLYQFDDLIKNLQAPPPAQQP